MVPLEIKEYSEGTTNVHFSNSKKGRKNKDRPKEPDTIGKHNFVNRCPLDQTNGKETNLRGDFIIILIEGFLVFKTGDRNDFQQEITIPSHLRFRFRTQYPPFFFGFVWSLSIETITKYKRRNIRHYLYTKIYTPSSHYRITSFIYRGHVRKG